MKKTIITLALAFGFGLFGLQSQAQTVNETNVTFQKQNVNGFVGQYQISKTDLQKIADNYFSNNLKSKSKKSKPYTLYSAVNWAILPLQTEDVYYEVTGDKKSSSLTIMVSKGYDNFVSSTTDPDVAQKVVSFFTDFNSEIDQYFLDQRIEDQKEVIAKLQKNASSASKDGDKLQSQLNKLQGQIKENQDKQNQINADIQKNQGVLDGLMSQKK